MSEKTNCRRCGKELAPPGTLCVDCFAKEVKASRTGPPHIEGNRFSGDMIEYGVLAALFDDLPASEVTCCSGAQNAFDAARIFLRSMIENQCHLAGCALQGRSYGVGDVHTEKCWFTKRASNQHEG